MKLFLISAPTSGYDVYSEAVVAAETPSIAATIHPDEKPEPVGLRHNDEYYIEHTWVSKTEEVTVEYLGSAKRGTKRGVICASFHAG
jgi:hypothetical protein